MCLVVLALHMHPRWPLVIAANRDEFHDRATAPMDWWPDSQPRILAGKDLVAGGAWMGLAEQGRMALLTNVRDPRRHRTDAPSRGALVSDWLQSSDAVTSAAARYRSRGCNPYNLLVADGGGSRWWWMHDGVDEPSELAPGLYGLSNAQLNSDWPKVALLKTALSCALKQAHSAEQLADELFAALADRSQPDDEALPQTGVGAAVERFLAPAFIAGEGLSRPYGTRASTVLCVEQDNKDIAMQVRERAFGRSGQTLGVRDFCVPRWPWQRPEVQR